MGRTRERKRAEAEEKARRKAIKRARKAATEARKDHDPVTSHSEGDRNLINEGWESDPRILLRVGPDFSLESVVRDATPGWTAGRKQADRTVRHRGGLLSELQERLFASAKGDATDAVLLVLQGLDTAGKGGIVRHVMGLVDPQGISVTAFKAPTEEERAHDFLWRIRPHLPAPGRIGVFDRSHYEDLLVPTAQALTGRTDENGQSWVVGEGELNRRYRDIYAFETEAARSGIRILKICLLVSYEEQGRRLRERLDRPEKNWKFSPSDLDTRDDWANYQTAYSEVLRRTSTRVAPWYAIPADDKWYARLAVTEILTRTLAQISPRWPAANFDVEAARARLDLSMTPEALLEWSQEKETRQSEWIAEDTAMRIAVDALNTQSDEDAEVARDEAVSATATDSADTDTTATIDEGAGPAPTGPAASEGETEPEAPQQNASAVGASLGSAATQSEPGPTLTAASAAEASRLGVGRSKSVGLGGPRKPGNAHGVSEKFDLGEDQA